MDTEAVTGAFDLLIEEVQKVFAALNAQGAQFMSEGRYEEATRLITSGKHIQGFKETLSELRTSWINGLEPEESADNEDKKPVRAGRGQSRAPKSRLRVRFSNGKTFDEQVAADTFAAALQEIGLERVRSLNKKVHGFALISTSKHKKYNQTRIGGVYVLTHSSTQAKKEMLDEITKALGIQATVTIVN